MSGKTTQQPEASARAPLLHELIYGLLLLAASCLIPNVMAADDVQSTALPHSDYAAARDALVEAIESEGLVVSAIIPFGNMLERTANALGKIGSPFRQAEIVQFCSAVLARQLIDEDPSQIALCPLSVAVFTLPSNPAQVSYAYRKQTGQSAGRKETEKLLSRLVDRAAVLARLH